MVEGIPSWPVMSAGHRNIPGIAAESTLVAAEVRELVHGVCSMLQQTYLAQVILDLEIYSICMTSLYKEVSYIRGILKRSCSAMFILPLQN
jgi:hypothetical protein